MAREEDKYSYNRFGSKGMRVGQASIDLAAKDQTRYTAEDILDAYSSDYVKQLQEAVETGLRLDYPDPFYVIVFTAKPMWATNVVRSWFIAKRYAPVALDTIIHFPHHTKTLYKVNKKSSEITVVWTLPGLEDCKSILKNKLIYSPELVRWIEECMDGKLDRDADSLASV